MPRSFVALAHALAVAVDQHQDRFVAALLEGRQHVAGQAQRLVDAERGLVADADHSHAAASLQWPRAEQQAMVPHDVMAGREAARRGCQRASWLGSRIRLASAVKSSADMPGTAAGSATPSLFPDVEAIGAAAEAFQPIRQARLLGLQHVEPEGRRALDEIERG